MRSSVRAAWRPRPSPGLGWVLLALTLLGLAVTVWLDRLLRQAGRPDLVSFTAGSAALTAATVIAATVGALVASRRLPGRADQRHQHRLHLLRRLRPAAHAHRDPAVAALVALVVAAGSLVGRFRRTRGTERQQLRWLAWGATLAATALVLGIAELVWHGDGPGFQVALGACLVSLLLATGAAILRYRLYDIDRRFNRRRHDAAQVIEAFSTRLRDQVDLDTLTAELLAVTHQTMQPAQAHLWLRPRR